MGRWSCDTGRARAWAVLHNYEVVGNIREDDPLGKALLGEGKTLGELVRGPRVHGTLPHSQRPTAPDDKFRGRVMRVQWVRRAVRGRSRCQCRRWAASWAAVRNYQTAGDTTLREQGAQAEEEQSKSRSKKGKPGAGGY